MATPAPALRDSKYIRDGRNRPRLVSCQCGGTKDKRAKLCKRCTELVRASSFKPKPRQVAVMQLLADGNSPEEVREILGIKRCYWTNFLYNLRLRLGVNHNEHMIACAMREGYIK